MSTNRSSEYENGRCPVCGTRPSLPSNDPRNSKRYLPVTIGNDYERAVGWVRGRIQHVCEVCRCVFVEEVEE